MSPSSEKISETLLTTSKTPSHQMSQFVFRFRESSKKFIVEILTKNLAFNFSGTLFVVGLGCSLKWWYRDQLLITLLKQNLPAFSEFQQKLSWESSEYIVGEQGRQFVQNTLSTSRKPLLKSSPPFTQGDKDPLLFPNEIEGRSWFPFAVPAGQGAQKRKISSSMMRSSKVPSSLNNLFKPRERLFFPLWDYQSENLGEDSNNFGKRSIGALNYLIERIDLFSNNVVIKFRQPWQKHVYQRFVGIFSEPSHIRPLKITSKYIYGFSNSSYTLSNSIGKNPKPVLFTKNDTNKYFGHQKNDKVKIEQKDLEQISTVLSVQSKKDVGCTFSRASKMQQHAQESPKRHKKVEELQTGNGNGKYTVWKPISPVNWFKISARSLCILNEGIEDQLEKISLLPTLFFQRISPNGYKVKKSITLLRNQKFKEKSSTLLNTNRIELRSILTTLKSPELFELKSGIKDQLIESIKETNTKNPLLIQSSTFIGKFSYPLELTTTMSRWRPPIDALVLNSYQDEIPYKLESTLLQVFCNKDNVPIYTDDLFDAFSLLRTQFLGNIIKKDEEFFSKKKIGDIKSDEPLKEELVNLLSLNDNTIDCGKTLSLPKETQSLKSSQTNLTHVQSKLEKTQDRSENFYKKLQFLKIKQLLKNELQTVINTLPLTFVDQPIPVAHALKSSFFYTQSKKDADGIKKTLSLSKGHEEKVHTKLLFEEVGRRRGSTNRLLPIDLQNFLFASVAQNPILSKSFLLPLEQNLVLNFAPEAHHAQSNIKYSLEQRKNLTNLEFLSKKKEVASDFSSDSLFLLNKLGISFNGLSPLNIPSMLLPINKDASFLKWQQFRKLTSGGSNLGFKMASKENYVSCIPHGQNSSSFQDKELLFFRAPGAKENQKKSFLHLLLSKGQQGLIFKSGRFLHKKNDNKPLLQDSNTVFYFNEKNRTWDILQGSRGPFISLSRSQKGNQYPEISNLEVPGLLTKNGQEKPSANRFLYINKTLLKEQKTTIANINDINLVDKKINFGKRKSRFMSGYVYPDIQTHSLKTNLYGWIWRTLPNMSKVFSRRPFDSSTTWLYPSSKMTFSMQERTSLFRKFSRLLDNVCLADIEISVTPTTFMAHCLQPQSVPLTNFRNSIDFISQLWNSSLPIESRGYIFAPKAHHVQAEVPYGMVQSKKDGDSLTQDGRKVLQKEVSFDQSHINRTAFRLLQNKINRINIQLHNFGMENLSSSSLSCFASHPKQVIRGPVFEVVSPLQKDSSEDEAVGLSIPHASELFLKSNVQCTEGANHDAFLLKKKKDADGIAQGASFIREVPYNPNGTDSNGILTNKNAFVLSNQQFLDKKISNSSSKSKKQVNELVLIQSRFNKLNHHLAHFPGFTRQNQLFLNFTEMTKGDDAISFKTLTSQPFSREFISDANGSRIHKVTSNNKAYFHCSPRKTAYRGIVVQRDKLTKDLSTASRDLKPPKDLLFSVSPLPAKQAPQIPSQKEQIEQRMASHHFSASTFVSDGQSIQREAKSSLQQNSIWATLFLGPENPLTNRQIHFFGQRKLSTIDTNVFQRDYLRQLGKETLMQANKKGFTEKSFSNHARSSTSVERTKILSFSKTFSSFFLKKEKYAYLLEEKDQWHILFKEQLHTALSDTRKYPPLTTEEHLHVENYGLGRIQISAPLVTARFPKRSDSKSHNFFDHSLFLFGGGDNLPRFLPGNQLESTELQVSPRLSSFGGASSFVSDGQSTQTLEEIEAKHPRSAPKFSSKLTALQFSGGITGLYGNFFFEPRQLQYAFSWRPTCYLQSSKANGELSFLGIENEGAAKLANFYFPLEKCEDCASFLLAQQARQPMNLQYKEDEKIMFSPWVSFFGCDAKHNEAFASKMHQAKKKRPARREIRNPDSNTSFVFVNHYPLLTERHNLKANSISQINKSSLPLFHAIQNLHWSAQEDTFWTILCQWCFLVALLSWVEQMLVGNVFPALSALEQLLLGAAGIKTGDRTNVLRISRGNRPKFQNIAGIDGLLGEIAELVLFLRGARFWNKKSSYGVLLTGSPGTGKTFLVRALANEAKVPVLILSAGTLTSSKTNSNKPSWSIRHAFRRAKQLAPCILFIDEIDALGSSRGKIITDVNEIVADASSMQITSNSPDLQDQSTISNSNKPNFLNHTLDSNQLQQSWPSLSKSLINEWSLPLKTLSFNNNEIDLCSLGESQIADFSSLSGGTKETFSNSSHLSSIKENPFLPTHQDYTSRNKTQSLPTEQLPGVNQFVGFAESGERGKRKFGPLTQLLVSMDGVSNLSGVLIMGATNRPETLDPALTRPGRFERVIRVEKPGEQKRIEILQLYSHNLGIQHQIPWSYLANRTVGLTAADLAVAMNYSSLKAILQGSAHTVETIEYGLNSIARFSNTSLATNTISSSNIDSKLGILKRRFQKLQQIAYYQAGKIVVQTLLPQHPPVPLITLNLSGVTTTTSADIYVPIDSAFNTYWCSSLESRLIGLYSGKAASFLFESQYNFSSNYIGKLRSLRKVNAPSLVSFASGARKKQSTQMPAQGKKRRFLSPTEIILGFQSNIGNLEIQSATRLATIMINQWAFYSSLTSPELFTNIWTRSLLCRRHKKSPILKNSAPTFVSSASEARKGQNAQKPGIERLTPVGSKQLEKNPFLSSQNANIMGNVEGLVKKRFLNYSGAFVPKPMESLEDISLRNDRDKSSSSIRSTSPFFVSSASFARKGQSTRSVSPSYPSSSPTKSFCFFEERNNLCEAKKKVFKVNRFSMCSLECYLRYVYSQNARVDHGDKNDHIASCFTDKSKLDTSSDATNLQHKSSSSYVRSPRGFLKQKAETNMNFSLKTKDALLSKDRRIGSNGAQRLKFSQMVLLNKIKGENLRFNLSQSRHSLFIRENQKSSYNNYRISVENVSKKVSSRPDAFQLINPLQFSNIQRDRLYPGWFRLYLPDIEATEFMKSVANYYFSLGLQTFTRPSLNQFAPMLLGGFSISQVLTGSVACGTQYIGDINFWWNTKDFIDFLVKRNNLLSLPRGKKSKKNEDLLFAQRAQETLSTNFLAISRSLDSLEFLHTGNSLRFLQLPLVDLYASTNELGSPSSSFVSFANGARTGQNTKSTLFPFIESDKNSSSSRILYSTKLRKNKAIALLNLLLSEKQEKVFSEEEEFLQETISQFYQTYALAKSLSVSQFSKSNEAKKLAKINRSEIDRYKLRETSFCQILDSSKDFNKVANLRSEMNLPARLDETAVEKFTFNSKTRSITLIRDVIFCCGGNNLSIGIGLLRSAAKRRTQLYIKSENTNTFRSRKISKKVSYPNVSTVLWGFSRPWNINRLLNIGFRQDSNFLRHNYATKKDQFSGYLSKILDLHYPIGFAKLNNLIISHKLCYSSRELLFAKIDKKMYLSWVHSCVPKVQCKEDAKKMRSTYILLGKYKTRLSPSRYTNFTSHNNELDPSFCTEGTHDASSVQCVRSKEGANAQKMQAQQEKEIVGDISRTTTDKTKGHEKLKHKKQTAAKNFSGLRSQDVILTASVDPGFPLPQGDEKREGPLLESQEISLEKGHQQQNLMEKLKEDEVNKVKIKGKKSLQSSSSDAGSYSFLLSLEKQKFPISSNDSSVVEKEFVYHTLINNCFAQAFFLVDQNRQLIDYFVDYLIRFQILRQHQILYIFSTMLLHCKKEK